MQREWLEIMLLFYNCEKKKPLKVVGLQGHMCKSRICAWMMFWNWAVLSVVGDALKLIPGRKELLCLLILFASLF